MIKFENVEVVGWEAAIRGMRNPKNSWDKSDSLWDCGYFHIGEKDTELMKKLSAGGPVHSKYLRMINVYVDITAPLYWWKEFDTYKVGTVTNSCSTMHKIHEKEFIMDDFSTDHLFNGFYGVDNYELMEKIVDRLEANRKIFLALDDDHAKAAWWQMIQLLPSSYNQKRTVMMNYQVLKNIYQPDCRMHHKLDEWSIEGGGFCKWIESLPYSELITGERG